MKDKNTPTNPEREPTPQEELVAYLDGELDNPGRERVEALLAEDPALREALKQHEAIAEALSAPQADDGPGANETLGRIHGRLRLSRTKITTMVLAAAASLVLAVLIGTRLFTGPRGPANPAGTQLATPVENPVFQPEVLADLDVLEVF